MSSYRSWLAILWLWGQASLAAAVSDAPLQALNAYIEHSGTCSERLVEWNREYNGRTAAGAAPRDFYYRVLGYLEWNECGRPFFRPILGELQKASIIFAKGLVTEAEFEAKEAELIDLFFAALEDGKRGAQMVRAYEMRTTARLNNLEPPKWFFNCTFFGDQPRCME